jgi:hypothetical protein
LRWGQCFISSSRCKARCSQTHGPVLPAIAPLGQDGDNGLNCRFYQGPRSIRLRWPKPRHPAIVPGSARLVQPQLAGDTCIGGGCGQERLPAGPAPTVPRCRPQARRAAKDAHVPACERRHAPRSGGRAVGSSSARRRGNHRFQSRLCRVGILGSVSPSNEC